MPSSYHELLRQAAIAMAIAPDQLLRTEEIAIDGNVIGLAHEPAGDRPGDIQLFTEVGQLPVDTGASLLRGLLEANYMGVGTGGCTLGVQQDANTVMLWGRFPLERLDPGALLDLLGRFADVAAFWRGQLGVPDTAARVPRTHGVGV